MLALCLGNFAALVYIVHVVGVVGVLSFVNQVKRSLTISTRHPLVLKARAVRQDMPWKSNSDVDA